MVSSYRGWRSQCREYSAQILPPVNTARSQIQASVHVPAADNPISKLHRHRTQSPLLLRQNSFFSRTGTSLRSAQTPNQDLPCVRYQSHNTVVWIPGNQKCQQCNNQYRKTAHLQHFFLIGFRFQNILINIFRHG